MMIKALDVDPGACFFLMMLLSVASSSTVLCKTIFSNNVNLFLQHFR